MSLTFTRISQRVPLLVIVAISAASCKKQQQSNGEVTRNWKPAEAPGFRGVPAPEVLAGITKKLTAPPPAPLTDDQWKHARQLYKTFPTGPLWLDEEGVHLPRTTALLKNLAAADSDGLRVDKFPVAAIQQSLAAVEKDNATADELAEADVILTAAYVALGENLLTGEIRPAGFSQAWHINPMEERIDSSLALTLREDDLGAGLIRMRPQDEGYAALRNAFGHYRELAMNGGWGTVPAGRQLKPGDHETPARLAALRQRLTVEGFLTDSTTAATPDSSATADSTRPKRSPAIGGAVYTKHSPTPSARSRRGTASTSTACSARRRWTR